MALIPALACVTGAERSHVAPRPSIELVEVLEPYPAPTAAWGEELFVGPPLRVELDSFEPCVDGYGGPALLLRIAREDREALRAWSVLRVDRLVAVRIGGEIVFVAHLEDRLAGTLSFPVRPTTEESPEQLRARLLETLGEGGG